MFDFIKKSFSSPMKHGGGRMPKSLVLSRESTALDLFSSGMSLTEVNITLKNKTGKGMSTKRLYELRKTVKGISPSIKAPRNKKQLSVTTKAKVLSSYYEERKIGVTQASFSKKNGISSRTLRSWLSVEGKEKDSKEMEGLKIRLEALEMQMAAMRNSQTLL